MIGAIIGDVVGSPYEGRRMKFFGYDFPLLNEKSTFTDDTIVTVATMKAILEDISYKDAYLEIGRKYLEKGYGSMFEAWLKSSDPQPYESWGNGSAMRISPIGLFYNDVDIIMEEAEKSSSVTHNHPDAIKGAQAVALAIHYSKIGLSKEEIKTIIFKSFDYEFYKDISFYKNNYKFDVTCKGTVEQALVVFFESIDFEDCVRHSVLMGGDTDTLACIAGSIAEAYYKHIPVDLVSKVLALIPEEFMIIVRDFYRKLK